MTEQEFADKLITRAGVVGIPVASGLIDPLWAYYSVLATWNRKINLTAVDLDDLPPSSVDRLFIEPLAAAAHANVSASVIDIGSGGGSPAIPFALATRAPHLTMVESRSRKSTFLREAARASGLRADVITARYEDAAQKPELRDCYGLLTIRAVRVDHDSLVKLGTFLSESGELFLLGRGRPNLESVPLLEFRGTHQLTNEATLAVWQRVFHVKQDHT